VTAVVPRAVLALTAVILVAATVLTLGRHGSHIVGWNGVPPLVFALSVPTGERVCQPIPPAPEPATRIRMTLGAYGRTGARIRAESPAGARGAPVAVRDGVIEVPAPPALSFERQLCVANVGDGRVALAGVTVPRRSGATIGRRHTRGVFSAVYLGREATTWQDRAGSILARVGYAKGLPGGAATGVVLIALLVIALGGALLSCWKLLRV
jgi:hypothetical protein